MEDVIMINIFDFIICFIVFIVGIIILYIGLKKFKKTTELKYNGVNFNEIPPTYVTLSFTHEDNSILSIKKPVEWFNLDFYPTLCFDYNKCNINNDFFDFLRKLEETKHIRDNRNKSLYMEVKIKNDCRECWQLDNSMHGYVWKLKDVDSMPDKKDNSIRFLFSSPYDDRYYSIEQMKRLIMKKNKAILLQNLK